MKNRLKCLFFIFAINLSGWVLALAAGGADHPAEPFRVALIRSSNMYLPAAMIQDQAMRESLSANTQRNVEFYVDDLDTMRFPGAEFESQFLRLLRLKYQGRKIDLLMAVGPDALRFAQRHRADIWPGVPMVFYSVAEDSLQGLQLQPEVTGIVLPFDLPGTIELALGLQANAKRMVVVSGTSNYDQNWLRRAREALRRYENRFDISYWINQRLPELLEALRKLPPDTIVLYLSFSRDADGDSFVPRDIARSLAEASSAPVYGILGTYIGQGIVGGSVASFAAHGKLAGEIAARVLVGQKAGEIPVQTSAAAGATLDWRQLQRWRLSERNLPANAIVEYKDVSFWQLYRWQLLGVAAVVALQTVLIVALLVQRGKRQRAQDALQQNEAALRASYNRIQDLAGKLIAAQEAERSRIARDLHDDVNQQLAGLSIALSNVKRRLHDGGDAAIQIELTRLQQRTIDLANVIRNLSHELHPGVLQHTGLGAALKGHCAEVGRQHAIEVTLSVVDGLDGIPQNVALCLYRVAQEALSNIAAHAGARKTQVTLRSTEDVLELVIADDGQGFNLAEARGLGGLGLISLDERVRLIGGSLTINTELQHGTEVRVQVPLGGNR